MRAKDRYGTGSLHTLLWEVGGWGELGGRGLLIAAAVPTLRRLPAFLALRSWMHPIDRFPDVLFMSWFGPIRVSALLYVMLVLGRVGDESVWVVSSLVVCASTVAHGLTATVLTRRHATIDRRTSIHA